MVLFSGWSLLSSAGCEGVADAPGGGPIKAQAIAVDGEADHGIRAGGHVIRMGHPIKAAHDHDPEALALGNGLRGFDGLVVGEAVGLHLSISGLLLPSASYDFLLNENRPERKHFF
ncbi:MAG: hypothetical protein ACRCTG_14595 [Aestuariivirga sp.]